MSKIDEFVKKWCMKSVECMKGDDYIMYDEDECRADLYALIESLLPSEEDVRMEFPIGGTMKAAYNRDYAEMIKDNQSRRLGAFWLRSRLLAAIDAKSIAQKPQENDKMLNKDAIDAKDDAKDLQDKH